MAQVQAQAHLRSLYRSILRELPPRPIASPPSPLRSRIRSAFSSSPADPSTENHLRRRQEAEQFIQYVKAQRMYITLLERYNPGLTMDDEDRIKLTARRVGMEMPVDYIPGRK